MKFEPDVDFDTGAAMRRIMKDWKSVDLARALGVSPESVSMWLTGKRVPVLTTPVKIMELTGATWRDFVGDTDADANYDAGVKAGVLDAQLQVERAFNQLRSELGVRTTSGGDGDRED